MKRSYPTNVDGEIFYIDEDAFILLQNYLQQLKTTFTGSEGGEIVADIESRIRELFNEKTSTGKTVIVLSDVENVIETMGRPEDLSESTNEEDTCSEAAPQATATKPFVSINVPSGKKLYRNMKNKVFGGVIGGLAVYLNWNANIMRLLIIVLALCTKLWPLFVIYLIAWMIIPPAVTPRQVLQMKGEPVNLDTVGQTIIASSPTTPPAVEDGNFFNTLFSIAGKCLLGLIGIVTSTITFACLIGFLAVLTGVISYYFADSNNILLGFELMTDNIVNLRMLWSALSALLTGTVLFALISWGCASVLFNLKRISAAWYIVLVVLLVILITMTVAFFVGR